MKNSEYLIADGKLSITLNGNEASIKVIGNPETDIKLSNDELRVLIEILSISVFPGYL